MDDWVLLNNISAQCRPFTVLGQVSDWVGEWVREWKDERVCVWMEACVSGCVSM